MFACLIRAHDQAACAPVFVPCFPCPAHADTLQAFRTLHLAHRSSQPRHYAPSRARARARAPARVRVHARGRHLDLYACTEQSASSSPSPSPSPSQPASMTEGESEVRQTRVLRAEEELVLRETGFADGRYGRCFSCQGAIAIPGLAQFFCPTCGWIRRPVELKTISPGHHD